MRFPKPSQFLSMSTFLSHVVALGYDDAMSAVGDMTNAEVLSFWEWNDRATADAIDSARRSGADVDAMAESYRYSLQTIVADQAMRAAVHP
jgi:hypothetical protein